MSCIFDMGLISLCHIYSNWGNIVYAMDAKYCHLFSRDPWSDSDTHLLHAENIYYTHNWVPAWSQNLLFSYLNLHVCYNSELFLFCLSSPSTTSPEHHTVECMCVSIYIGADCRENTITHAANCHLFLLPSIFAKPLMTVTLSLRS